MLQSIDITTVLLSAIFAGIVATLVTVCIEKFGGLLGGVLGTIPTTIVPASYGIWISSTETEFIASMSVIPLGMMINAVFLSVWVLAPKVTQGSGLKSGILVTSLSLSVWTLCGIIVIKAIGFGDSVGLSGLVLGIIGFLLLVLLGVGFTWNATPAPKGKNKPNALVLAGRGLMASVAIGLAVIFSSMGMPLVSGLASVFPAIFLTTMVALWFSQDSSVSIGAAGPMMLGGASVAVFSLLAIITYPVLGLVLGLIISWFSSILFWSIPAFFFLRRRAEIASKEFESKLIETYRNSSVN